MPKSIDDLLLTSKKMVFQASFLHELIDKQQFILLPTVSQQLYKIRMRKSTQEIHLWLHKQITIRQEYNAWTKLYLKKTCNKKSGN